MILRNLSWLALSQAVRLLLALFIGAWLTRSIGPGSNGLLGTTAVIGALAGFIADFGIRQVLVKELAARPQHAAALFGTAARITSVLGLAMYGLALAMALIWGGEAMAVLGLLMFSPLVLNGWITVLSRWDAAHESHRTAKLNLVANLVSSALKVVCILTGANLTFAAATFAMDAVFGAFTAWSWAARRGWLSDLRLWDAGFARALLRESLPLFLAHSGTLLLLKLDQLMVFKIAGDREAGIYAAATRLSEVVYALGPMMIIAFLPRLSESHAQDPARYVRQRGVLFGVMTCAAYASILGWWLLGAEITQWLYGPAFASAASVIMVHCLAALPFLHGELRNSVLVVERKSYAGAQSALVGVLINGVLNLVWIPRHGALGAAWATVVAYSLVWFGGSLALPALRAIGRQQLQSLTAPLWLWQPAHWQSLRRPTPPEPLATAEAA